VKEFDALTARIVRLNIMEATDPAISEFQPFAP